MRLCTVSRFPPICLSLYLSLHLSLTLDFFGKVMSPYHPDQMSQGSQVSGIALLRCSPNVFVCVIVFVFVFVFVIVPLLVSSCPLITLIKCLKGHKSLESLSCCVFKKVTIGARSEKNRIFWDYFPSVGPK